MRERYEAWWNELTSSREWLLAAFGVGPDVTTTLDQPDIQGEVVLVASDIVVIRVANELPSPLPDLVAFAVYRDQYKGEALLVRSRGRLVACQMIKVVDGATVRVGDGARTIL